MRWRRAKLPCRRSQGSLANGQVDVFLLKGLKQGQTLYALMENTSGNLDPVLAIPPTDKEPMAILTEYRQAVADLVATSTQPLVDLPALNDRSFLAWDDDSGHGYSAALQFTVPEDGDYILAASSSLSSAGRQTAGCYRLLIGLDAPEVLAGTAEPSGAIIAVQDQIRAGIPAHPGIFRQLRQR